MKRKALSKITRFDVFKRDGFVCTYCGSTPPGVVLQVDHIFPVCNGGTNDVDNLCTACDTCNLGKGGRELSVAPATIKEKAAILREKEDQIIAFNELLASKSDRLEQMAWVVAQAFMDGWNEGTILKVHFASIKKFCDKLPLDDLEDGVRIALFKFSDRRWTRNTRETSFRYFCGICWKKIKEGSHAAL